MPKSLQHQRFQFCCEFTYCNQKFGERYQLLNHVRKHRRNPNPIVFVVSCARCSILNTLLDVIVTIILEIEFAIKLSLVTYFECICILFKEILLYLHTPSRLCFLF